MNIVEIKDLTVKYGDKTVLDGVNFAIGPRDFIGVIGPNGGGKTTLMKSILRTLTPASGSVTYADNSMKIGYLPQIKSIDKSFPISVDETILSGLMSEKGLWGRFRAADKQKVAETMRMINIDHLSGKHIGELSGGELQRVFLARALISDPQLLILDEPTNYVDNKFEKELYELLKRLNERFAIVMVSHDLGTITSYVKSILCVNRTVHLHNSNIITPAVMEHYDCPIQIIAHGHVPHTILKQH